MARPDEAFLGLYEHPFVGPDGRITQIWYDALQALNARSNSSGAGTVTSVALTAPPEFTVTGSPVTTAGTLAIAKATETANTVWAGPTTGAAAQPAFRALVAADVPSGFVTGSSLTSGAVIVGAGGSTIAAAANSVVLSRATVMLDDAQIKALPTTPVQIIAAPGSGFWNRIVAVTYRMNSAGNYTNINATYADVHGLLDTFYESYGPVDDASTTPPLTTFTQLFANGSVIYEVAQPTMSAVGTGAAYVQNISVMGVTMADNKPFMLVMDNNGSGNLTGGNAANTLKVTVYYVVEVL